MFDKLLRKLRRTARHWTTDTTRSDRNAVIQRIVTAAAQESKDRPPGEELRRGGTPPPGPSPLAAQLLGQESGELPIPGEAIGARAHDIWVKNGRPDGTAAADWALAEAELRAERRSPS